MTAKERDELRVLTEAWSNQVAVIIQDERARIRRELLEWLDRQPSYAEQWVHRGDFRDALDRIAPEGKG